MSKREQTNYYAIISATVRYDTNLKSAEKLYKEITSLANKNGCYYAKNIMYLQPLAFLLYLSE